MGFKHETTLGQIALEVVDGPFGSNLPASAYVAEGIPVIRGSNLSLGQEQFKDSEFVYVSEMTFKKLKRSECIAGDILFTKKGTLGQTGIIPQKHRFSRFLLSSNQMRLRVDEEKAIPEYVYYFVSSANSKEKIKRESESTGVPKINLEYLKNFHINLPSVESQSKIVSVLQSLDNKIKLNRQTNQTLEQMAQALFKSWFVDFDPVIDNALAAGNDIPQALQHRATIRKAARKQAQQFPASSASPKTKSNSLPNGLPQAIRALFPSEFEQTDEPTVGIAGWIPKGWKSSDIGSSFDVTMGQSPPGSTYNENGEGIAFYQGRADFGFRYPKNRVYCTAPKRLANKFDTLVSVRAPVGDVNMAKENCSIGRGVAAVRHKSGVISFTYYTVQNLSHYFERFEGEGTVFGSINQKDFKNLPYVAPCELIIKKFEALSSTLDEKINLNSKNLSEVESLRDTLLPKLISGEITLNQDVA